MLSLNPMMLPCVSTCMYMYVMTQFLFQISSQPSGSVTMKQPWAFGRLQHKLQHPAQPYELKEGSDQEHYNPNELNFMPLESNSGKSFVGAADYVLNCWFLQLLISLRYE